MRLILNVTPLAAESQFGTLSSGTSVDTRLTSAGGMDYIKIVELI